jgi:ABC-type multidrug transport system fused ATPase/permease subunit
VAVLKPGLVNAVHRHRDHGLPPYARLARAETLALRRSEFVEARAWPRHPSRRIITGQILPLCLSSVTIRATLDMAGIILTAAGLGFLGLGAQPPMAEWGAMIAAGATTSSTPGGSRRCQALPFWRSASASTCWVTDCATCSIRSTMTEPHGGRPLLSVEGLTVTFPAPEGPHAVVRDFALTMGREKIGIVGESGSGKSITARSILASCAIPAG